MKKYFSFLVLVVEFNLYAYAQTTLSGGNVSGTRTSVGSPQKDTLTITTFKTVNGFGYDIYIKSQKYIHQENIPAVSGNRPFKTKADAEKTAEFVKNKITKNIMPPSVTPKELDSLGVLR